MAHLWMSADAHGQIDEYLWLSTHISRLLTGHEQWDGNIDKKDKDWPPNARTMIA